VLKSYQFNILNPSSHYNCETPTRLRITAGIPPQKEVGFDIFDVKIAVDKMAPDEDLIRLSAD
jgi:hypothetical protein